MKTVLGTSWFYRWGMVLAATTLNILGALAAKALGTGLFLDSWASMVVVAFGGLVPGLLVAVLTNVVLWAFQMVPFPFVACHLLTVLGAWALLRKEVAFTAFLGTGILAALTNGVVGSIISLFVFGGRTVVNAIDFVVMSMMFLGESLDSSVFWAGMLTNSVDKLLSAFLAWSTWLGVRRILQKTRPSLLARAANS